MRTAASTRRETKDKKTCPFCLGTGMRGFIEHKKDCPRCGGNGKIDETTLAIPKSE